MSPNVQIKSIYHGYTILYNMLVKMLFQLCTPFLEHRQKAVLFVWRKEAFMEYTPKTIYCPSCGRKVATWDGRAKTNIISKCKKCQKKIVFWPSNYKTEIKDLPKRNCSSGMTYL